jgi:hypothetical protein
MVRRFCVAVALVALLPLAAGQAQAGIISIDFDTFPGGAPVPSGTPLTTQYSALGVVFTGFENGVEIAPEVRAQQFISVPASQPNYLTNFSNFPSTSDPDRLDEIRMTFSVPVSDVNMIINTATTNTITFDLYDMSGTFLGSQSRVGNGVLNVPISLSGADIGRISAFQPTDGWWWSVDNLEFTPVPEPATLSLLGLGLLAVARKRRRC